MLSRIHSPQKVLPITYNKTHTHPTSDITPLLSSFQNKKEKSSTLFCFSLYNQPMENYSFRTFISYPDSGESSSAWFKADFGLFQLVSAISASGRYDPIQPIRPDFGQIGANWAKSAWIWGKKKGSDAAQAAASNATPCIGPRQTPVRHSPNHIRAS